MRAKLSLSAAICLRSIPLAMISMLPQAKTPPAILPQAKTPLAVISVLPQAKTPLAPTR